MDNFFARAKKALVYDILDFVDFDKISLSVKEVKYKKFFNYFLFRRKSLKKEYVNHTLDYIMVTEKTDGTKKTTTKKNISILKINNCLVTDYGLDYISESYQNVFNFDFSKNSLSDKLLQKFVDLITWPSLRILKLSENFFSDSGLLSIKSHKWNNLRILDFSFNKLREKGMDTLATQLEFPRLVILDLSFNNLGDEGINNLCKNTSFTMLEELYVKSTYITSVGLESILSNTSWKLKKLFVNRNFIDTTNFLPLLSSGDKDRIAVINQTVSKLKKFEVSENRNITMDFIVWLQVHALSLFHLNLSTINIEADSLQGSFKSLEELSLYSSSLNKYLFPLVLNMSTCFRSLVLVNDCIDDKQIPILLDESRRENLRFLTELNLSHNKFSKLGVELLAKSDLLPSLKKLDISDNKLGKSIDFLIKAKNWPELSYLNIADSMPIEEYLTINTNTSFTKLNTLVLTSNNFAYSKVFLLSLKGHATWRNLEILDNVRLAMLNLDVNDVVITYKS